MSEPNKKIKELKQLETTIRQLASQVQNDEELTPVYVKLLSSIADLNDLRQAVF